MWGKEVLKIDEEALNNAANVYSTQHASMAAICEAVRTSVEGLRNDWKSAAGDEFFKKYDDGLQDNLQLYADVLKHMSDNIDQAKKKYAEVIKESEKLKTL